jgi:hypothetical protein
LADEFFCQASASSSASMYRLKPVDIAHFSQISNFIRQSYASSYAWRMNVKIDVLLADEITL